MPAKFDGKVRRFAFLAVLLSAGMFYPVRSASAAATTSQLTVVYFQEDQWYNYDFRGDVAASNYVDWPNTAIFYNNSSVNKVKAALNPYMPSDDASTKYAAVNDGGGFQYDQDRGRKVTSCPPTGWFQHYRIFADADDRMYNTSYGYWNLVTMHFDYNDGCAGAQHGYSETADSWLAYWSRQVWGSWNVFEDYGYMYNPEPLRVDIDENGRYHTWWNAGYASYISVP
jgi:hypothetical protein